MVFQHSVTPRDLLFAHILAVSSAKRGFNQGIWLAAASLNRYLQAFKQPQVFGTQFHTQSNGPDTQDPYDQYLLSDELRADWCVAPISEQVKILADLKAGKPFRSARLCK
jgi:hypothetical protein